MCGIAGYVGLDDPALLEAMCRAITHRGPDDEGFYVAPGVGLSMRRLSVIDLTTGHQPISNETGDVWVVFNGEIYNYQPLRDELRRRGHVFKTSSDTETIVHAYEEYGLTFVDHLRGMFAIAIWDERRRRLVLVRDRVGEKPLYYTTTGRGLLFGSEPKAILQRTGRREEEPQAICDFLAMGYVAGPHTFYRGLAKLLPGELLVHEAGRTSVHRYWTRRRVDTPGNEAHAAEELAARLQEVVKLCLKSDVEVGAFLSGGLDSSLLVGLMRAQSARVKTFSVGFSGRAAGFNELSYARKVADHAGTDHRELILGPGGSMELLPQILWHYDEPHGEPTSVLVHQLCEFTRQHVKVAVGGTGGDELFFGYPRHRGVRLFDYYRLLPPFVRRQMIERVVGRWPESTKGARFAKRAKRFIAGASEQPASAYLSWVSLLQADVRERLLSARVKRDAPDPAGDAFLRRHLMADGSLLERAASLDVEGYLPEYQLTYMDRMSMAHGLEVRSPYCDYQLVEFAMSLPVDFRLKRLTSKYLLKKVAAKWVLPSVISRAKVGFDSPIGEWFKNELSEFLTRFLAPDRLRVSGLLDPDAVTRLIAEHRSGQRDYSLQLWTLIALEGWHRMYIQDNVRSADAYRFDDRPLTAAVG